MNLFFQMILALTATLALCVGCGTDPSGTSHDSSIAQADGGNGDSGMEAGTNDGSNDVQSSQPDGNVEKWDGFLPGQTPYYLTLEAKTPDGLPATFYLCDSHCVTTDIKTDLDKHAFFKNEGVEFTYSVFKTQSGREFEIHVYRENHLFVPWITKIEDAMMTSKKNTSISHEWTDVGSWGLAPDGTYTSSQSGKNVSVTTSVKNGKVTLTWGSKSAIVTDHELSKAPNGSNNELTGKIDDDLHSFHVQVSFPDTPSDNYEDTLTIVK